MENVDYLEKYSKSIRDKGNLQEKKLIEEILNKILDYLTLEDLYNKTNRATVFKRLYIEEGNFKMFEIAYEFHMDTKTLYNLRKKFNILVELELDKYI